MLISGALFLRRAGEGLKTKLKNKKFKSDNTEIERI